jgi:hypothetical protein
MDSGLGQSSLESRFTSASPPLELRDDRIADLSDDGFKVSRWSAKHLVPTRSFDFLLSSDRCV